jgi:hypothetical protein
MCAVVYREVDIFYLFQQDIGILGNQIDRNVLTLRLFTFY